MGKIISNSANLTYLGAKVIFDIPAKKIFVDLSPTQWIDPSAVVGARLKVVDPGGVVLHDAVSFLPPNMDQIAQVSIPTVAGGVKYGVYAFTVTLEDGSVFHVDSTSFDLECVGKTDYRTAEISINPKCKDGKTVVYASLPGQYKETEAEIVSKAWSYYFPVTAEMAKVTSTFDPFSVALVEGRNAASVSYIAKYSFGDFLVNIEYKGSLEKDVRCTSSLCNVYPAISTLVEQHAVCDEVQKASIETKLDAATKLIVAALLGEQCGYDVSDIIGELYDLLSITNINVTNILPGTPAAEVVIQACNMETETVGLTTVYKFDNKIYEMQANEVGAKIISKSVDTGACLNKTTFTFDWNKLSSYIIQSFTTQNFNTLIGAVNKSLDAVDPKCVTTKPAWGLMSLTQRIQAIVDKQCECCGENSTGLSNVSVSCETATVPLTWVVGTADTGNVVVDVTNPNASVIDVSFIVSGNGISGTKTQSLATGDTSVSIPVSYTGGGNGGPTPITIQATTAAGATSCQANIDIDQPVGCTAPISPGVSISDTTVTVQFSPALSEPPSYVVKRRRYVDADIPGNYITLPGSPTYNAGTGKYSITETFGPNELNYVWVYRVESQCPGSTPFVTVNFAAQTCPTINLTASETGVSYSFVGNLGETAAWRVYLFDGATQVGAMQTKAPANPVTGTFSGLTPGVLYTVKAYADINLSGFTQTKECTATISTLQSTQPNLEYDYTGINISGALYFDVKDDIGNVLVFQNVEGVASAGLVYPSNRDLIATVFVENGATGSLTIVDNGVQVFQLSNFTTTQQFQWRPSGQVFIDAQISGVIS